MRRSNTELITEARTAARNGRARQLRENANLSQDEIAAAVGVTQQAVALWETGQRLPRGDHAAAYGRLLRRLAWWAIHS